MDRPGLRLPVLPRRSSARCRHHRASAFPRRTLAAIKAILDAPDDETLAELLDAERARAADELRAHELALAGITRLAASPTAVRYDVTIVDRPARRLAALTDSARVEDLGSATGRLCRLVVDRLTPAGITIGDGLVGLFPLDLPDVMTIAVGAPVDSRIDIPDGLDEVIVPGGGWASTTHVGPYDALTLAYTALLDRVAELGHDPVGPAEETYLNDPTTAAPHELVTHIAVLLASG